MLHLQGYNAQLSKCNGYKIVFTNEELVSVKNNTQASELFNNKFGPHTKTGKLSYDGFLSPSDSSSQLNVINNSINSLMFYGGAYVNSSGASTIAINTGISDIPKYMHLKFNLPSSVTNSNIKAGFISIGYIDSTLTLYNMFQVDYTLFHMNYQPYITNGSKYYRINGKATTMSVITSLDVEWEIDPSYLHQNIRNGQGSLVFYSPQWSYYTTGGRGNLYAIPIQYMEFLF